MNTCIPAETNLQYVDDYFGLVVQTEVSIRKINYLNVEDCRRRYEQVDLDADQYLCEKISQEKPLLLLGILQLGTRAIPVDHSCNHPKKYLLGFVLVC